jgi:penicillin-insensitive murein endopeptidase
MRPSRHRFYGHPTLIAFIQRMAAGGDHPLLIGDLSQPRGGPMPTGHTSHQIGLDADIWFTADGVPGEGAGEGAGVGVDAPGAGEGAGMGIGTSAGAPTALDPEMMAAPSLVTADFKALNRTRWRSNYGQLLLQFAEQPEVERIFVNAAIKQELCNTNRRHPALRKIRPWYLHDEHFHVRLKCPTGETDCVAQNEPPLSAECDEHLTWWFTDPVIASERASQEGPSSVRGQPQLPSACERL